ncbi:androgen-dependent TFPI-regulating protein-like isoform X2 [Spodoptera frugiperda]|nr:androgen-dependent TFPI-regulating protein-like isoform X2 [Spodoptera frugiperda]
MSRLSSLRILGYSATILMHVSNIVYMAWYSRQNAGTSKEVLQFKSLEYRFFTTWTFILQLAYAVYALACEYFTLKNAKKKEYKLPSPITDFREILFAGLVWPSTMVVFTVFWGLYNYDRTLIFPKFLDEVIPPISNHVIHTMIVPVALWEVMFRPRQEPETHARNVMQLTLHLCVYVSVMYFTYIERGVWLYPIFRKLFGTVYFFIALALMGVMFYTFYYIQWPLTKMIHGSKKKAEKKKTKLEKKNK